MVKSSDASGQTCPCTQCMFSELLEKRKTSDKRPHTGRVCSWLFEKFLICPTGLPFRFHGRPTSSLLHNCLFHFLLIYRDGFEIIVLVLDLPPTISQAFFPAGRTLPCGHTCSSDVKSISAPFHLANTQGAPVAFVLSDRRQGVESE